MSINRGTTAITALYRGTTAITAVYRGATQVFGAAAEWFPATNPPTGISILYNGQSAYAYNAGGDGTGYRAFKKLGNTPVTIRWYYNLTPNEWRSQDGVTRLYGITQA